MPPVGPILSTAPQTVSLPRQPTLGADNLQRMHRARQTLDSLIAQFQTAAAHPRPCPSDSTPHANLTAQVAARIESVANVELSHVTDADGLHAFANPFTATVGRTLTNRPPKDAPAAIDQRAPVADLTAKEFKTLSSQHKNLKIVITPGTLIYPGGPINFISSKPDRAEWHGLPSILFTLPKTADAPALATPSEYADWLRTHPYIEGPDLTRAGFGHFRSFASNRAFGETPTEKAAFASASREHSDAELFDRLKAAVADKNLIKTRPDSANPYERDTLIDGIKPFDDALRAWAPHAATAQAANVEHNEIATRLWPWDVSHVAMGPPTTADNAATPHLEKDATHRQRIEAIQTAVVLSIKRMQLAQALVTVGPGCGTEHPVLHDFLTHQASFAPNGSARTLNETRQVVSSLSADEKVTLALTLAEKLLEKVSVVAYSAGDESFQSTLKAGALFPVDARAVQDIAQQEWLHAPQLPTPASQQRLVRTQAIVSSCIDAFAHNRREVMQANGTPPSETHTLLQRIESMAPINLLHTEASQSLRRFGDPHSAYMARSLIDEQHANKPDDTAAATDHLARGARLASLEYDMLANRLVRRSRRVDVLITPTTAILPKLPIEVMSNPYAPKLDRWANNATVIYQFSPDPTQGENTELGRARTVVGHVRSIKSNQAFTDAFNTLRHKKSKAEGIGMLAEQIRTNWPAHAKEPRVALAYQYPHLRELLHAWGKEKIADRTQTDATHGLEHNEVLMRVWPWDISHVSLGHLSASERSHPDTYRARFLQALGVTGHLSQQRLKLAQELCAEGGDRGINHPLFVEALQHQRSSQGADRPLTKEATFDDIMQLSADEKTTLLLGLVERLLEPVSLVQYTPGKEEFEPLDTQQKGLVRHEDMTALAHLLNSI